MTPLYPDGVYAPLPRFSKKTQTNIAPSATRNTISARCSRDAPIISAAWSSKGPSFSFASGSTLAPRRGLLPEEREGARVAVQEGRAADGSDLAVAEEAAERDLAQLLAEEIRVVVGPAKEMRTPAQAGKEECSGGSHTHQRAVALEQPGQVLGRCAGVTQEELRDLQLLEVRADRDCAARPVDADQVAHQQLIGVRQPARARVWGRTRRSTRTAGHQRQYNRARAGCSNRSRFRIGAVRAHSHLRHVFRSGQRLGQAWSISEDTSTL